MRSVLTLVATIGPPAAFAFLLAAVACSSSAPSGPPTFTAAPLMTVMSKSGALAVEVRTSPQPPGRGTNYVELTILGATDKMPRSGLTLSVTPWMPAMNHGTSIVPKVSPAGDAGAGAYLISDVDLFMPGLWQLRTTITGSMTDEVAPRFQIP